MLAVTIHGGERVCLHGWSRCVVHHVCRTVAAQGTCTHLSAEACSRVPVKPTDYHSTAVRVSGGAYSMLQAAKRD